MTDILKTPSAESSPEGSEQEEQNLPDLVERFHKARGAAAQINQAGLRRGDASVMALGSYGPFMNMAATTLIGVLLWVAMREGISFLHDLMSEIKEQRSSNGKAIDDLKNERTQDRMATQKHASEAADAIRELTRAINRAQYFRNKPPTRPDNKSKDEDERKEEQDALGVNRWRGAFHLTSTIDVLKKSVTGADAGNGKREPASVSTPTKSALNDKQPKDGIRPTGG